MDKEEFDKRKAEFVFNYYLEIFVEENKVKFKDVFLSEISSKLFSPSPENLVIELVEFISHKMYALTYDEKEVMKVKEKFISELN